MDGIDSIAIVVPITGAMLVLRHKGKDGAEVVAATDNSTILLGFSPKELFGLKCLTEILDEACVQDFLDSVDAIADDRSRLHNGQPIIFPLSTTDSQSSHKKSFWCAVHQSQPYKDFLIVELEKDRLNENFDPRRRRNRECAQKSDISNRLETETETHTYSKIRLREPSGEEKAMQVSSVLSQLQEQLSRPHNLESLMTTAVWLLKGMLDVEEVSVIRFDGDWNGSIMAKLGNSFPELPDSKWLTATSLPNWQHIIFKRKKVNVQKGRHPIESRLILRSRGDLSAVSNLNTSNCLLNT